MSTLINYLTENCCGGRTQRSKHVIRGATKRKEAV